MKFISTQSDALSVSIEEAIDQGLASDGGLFIPEHFPDVDHDDIATIDDYPTFAYTLLKPFFADSSLEPHVLEMCQTAFTFPAPLVKAKDNIYLLELFHGPTLSFKDFGARFLAECVQRIPKDYQQTILVATSGDTGSAVASAFYQKEQQRVAILFPKGKISSRQEQQLTCWDNNITSIAVNGNFDDCQKIVKNAFIDPDFQSFHLTSANSINIGRLLPQVVYYAFISSHFFKQHHEKINVIVPSGNLGNVTAAYWAKTMGFPIDKIVIACNENNVVPQYFSTHTFNPQPSKHTLANAMDIGNPSNFERLKILFAQHPELEKNSSSQSVSDDTIKATIKRVYDDTGIVICPHTATGFYLAEQMPNNHPWVVVATAHPSKFETIIEPLLNITLPIPKQLQRMLEREKCFLEINPNEFNKGLLA